MPSILLEANATDIGLKPLWRDGPNTRGTFDIIALCLSTVFISAWSAYHPHLPSELSHKRNRVKDFVHAILLFFFVILLPEGLPVRASLDLVEACALWRQANSKGIFARHPNTPWYPSWFTVPQPKSEKKRPQVMITYKRFFAFTKRCMPGPTT